MFSTSRLVRASVFGLSLSAFLAPVVALALSVDNLTPGTTVSVASPLMFSVTGAASSTTFYLSDSFNGSSLDNSKISSSGAFSWTPLIQDIGAHTITISAYDSSGNPVSASQSITVAPRFRVSISSLSPGSNVSPGQTVTFTATSTGFTNPTFSVSDSFAGGTLSISKINGISGAFNWTPTASDVGTHSVTVQATDSSYNNASATQQINVTGTATSSAPSTTAPLPGVTPPATPPPPPVIPTVTTPPSTYTFVSNLKIGSTGDEVTALQNLLAHDGFYSGAATGYFGSLTGTAVAKYQTAHGLDPLGVVGPATRALLNAEAGGGTPTPSTPAAPSVSGNVSVRHSIIQQLLLQLQQMQALLIQLESVNN